MKFFSLKLLLYFIFLLFISCAKTGMPSGGPKDETPPNLLISKPPNFTKNFKENKIILKFDEYIVLSNAQQNLLISPPLEEKAEMEIKGKSLIIKLKSDLADSTTYNFNFGNAITDNNEGNILKDFQYIFSTGNEIDSFSIQGQLKNAIDLTPEKDVIVMIYENLNDTVPQTILPTYIDRTDENGNFKINNIKKSTYKLFALKDANSNFLFDLPNEALAFTETFFTPSVKISSRKDTIVLDSLRDSISVVKFFDFEPKDIELFLFEEDNKLQYLLENKREKPYLLNFIFNRSLKEELKIKSLDFEDNCPHILESNLTNDTINYWLKDSSIYNKDTLFFEISYHQKDSLDNEILTKDTLKMLYKSKKNAKKSLFRKAKKERKEKLVYKSNLRNKGKIDLHLPIYFNFKEPLNKIDTSKIQLFEMKDSIAIAKKFIFQKRENYLKKYKLIYDWKEEQEYQLLVDSMTFTGISHHYNDSLFYEFETKNLDEYGKILLSIESDKNATIILNLLDDKKNILKKQHIILKKGKQKFTFDFLDAKSYGFKIIFDKNNNKKWDTGKYEDKTQAEKIIFYEKEIKVRANWDIEIDWEI